MQGTEWVLALWRRRCKNRPQSLICPPWEKHKLHFCYRSLSEGIDVLWQGSQSGERVTFRLDLCPLWIGVSRDVCGLRGVYDLHLYTLRPLGCFPFFSCRLRQFVCSPFLFHCQLWMTAGGEVWAILWAIWLRLTLSYQSPLMPFKAKAVGRALLMSILLVTI